MILYFSATGNTEYIARELAKRLDDECVNLLERFQKLDFTVLHSQKPFIVCAPVYVCEMPRFMSKYLKQQTFSGSKDVYCIFTSGGYCGISGQHAKWIFQKKKMNYHGHAVPRISIVRINASAVANAPSYAHSIILKSRIKSLSGVIAVPTVWHVLATVR